MNIMAFEGGRGLPCEAEGRNRFLYLVQFKDRLKIGVTYRPAGRIAQLRAACGLPICVWLTLQNGFDASDRENIISRILGGPTGTPGRFSEWLCPEGVGAALSVMAAPLAPPDRLRRSRRLLKAEARRLAQDPAPQAGAAA